MRSTLCVVVASAAAKAPYETSRPPGRRRRSAGALRPRGCRRIHDQAPVRPGRHMGGILDAVDQPHVQRAGRGFRTVQVPRRDHPFKTPPDQAVRAHASTVQQALVQPLRHHPATVPPGKAPAHLLRSPRRTTAVRHGGGIGDAVPRGCRPLPGSVPPGVRCPKPPFLRKAEPIPIHGLPDTDGPPAQALPPPLAVMYEEISGAKRRA